MRGGGVASEGCEDPLNSFEINFYVQKFIYIFFKYKIKLNIKINLNKILNIKIKLNIKY